MATWSQLTLQDAGSPIMEEFIFFHDFSLIILSMILIFVSGIMGLMLSNLWINTALSESQLVECIWTILPALVLTQLAIPSLYLLYMMDESALNALTLKIMAHQWYWSYEYSDFWTSPSNLEFDSYMEPGSSSNFRLLDTDNRVVLPYNTPIRGLVSSADVLHAWAIPGLGVKSDACPGRLNQIKLTSSRPGLWFGQCSEICGANHSFMPIVLEMISAPQFLKWVELNQE